jgi:predicted ester cyclase
MVIYRVEEHQIVDQWCMFDAVSLLKQLGAADRVLSLRS